VTQIDPRTSLETQAMPAIRAELEKAGLLGRETVVTAVLVVVQTETMGRDGSSWRVHRLTATGPISPSLERGLLGDALRDAERRR
jgi:hypothetical protein